MKYAFVPGTYTLPAWTTTTQESDVNDAIHTANSDTTDVAATLAIPNDATKDTMKVLAVYVKTVDGNDVILAAGLSAAIA